MTELMKAHANWASRPADQKHLTLESLLAATSANRLASRERTVHLGDLTLGATDDEVTIESGAGSQPARFTNWAFGQMATLAGAPASYLRKLPTKLAQINLEAGIEFLGNRGVETKLYYRDDGMLDVLQASTGPQYGRIFDSQVVTAVIDMNDDGRWTVPLQAYDGVLSEKSTTLYASDRDVFIFLVDEVNAIELDGDTFYRGFFVSNSEVGKAVLEIDTFLYNRVCANRIVWGAREVVSLRIRHTHFAPDRFASQAAPALKALSESSAQPIAETLRKAKQTQIGKSVADVEKWLKGKGFSRLESDLAMNMAQREGTGSRNYDPTNLYDLVQGGTAAARSIEHADTRVEQERKWSRLLNQVRAQ